MNGVENFSRLKPGVLHDEGLKILDALYKQATLNLETLYEPIKIFGGSAIRVFFGLYMNSAPIGAERLARMLKMPLSSVYDGLKKNVEAGFAEKDGPLYRLTPKFRRNV